MTTDVTREPGDPRSDTPRWICICAGLSVPSAGLAAAQVKESRAGIPAIWNGLTRIDLVLELTGYSYSRIRQMWVDGKIQHEKQHGACYVNAQEVLEHKERAVRMAEEREAARAEAREEKRRKALERIARRQAPRGARRRQGTPNPSNVLLFETWSGFGSAPTEPRLGGRSYQEEYTSYV